MRVRFARLGTPDVWVWLFSCALRGRWGPQGVMHPMIGCNAPYAVLPLRVHW